MKKILVIEDEEEIRLNILKILNMEGFEAFGAENGRMGVEQAKQHLPDLIICDVMMPELNGYGVLTELRSDSFTAAIPFIFLTAMSETSDFRKGMSLGADDYLTKPFMIDDLLAAIRTRLEKHETVSKMAAARSEEPRFNLKPSLPRELRTPLAAMLEIAASLSRQNNLPEPDTIAAMGNVLQDNTLRVQRIVENYLLYAELRLVKYEQNVRNLWQCADFIETESFLSFFATHEAIEAGRQKDLQLHLVDAGIQMSAKSLQKVVRELVNNAFAFSEPGTPVSVETSVHRDQFRLKITDHGPGIPKKFLAAIAAYNKPDRPQESGLGLLITRLLVHTCGGDMTIESLPNQGTTINVVLKKGK